MKKKRFILIVGLLGLMSLLVGPVQAQDKVIEWRFHTPHSDGRSEWVMEKEWCDTITKATNGRLKVTPYPAGALGFKDADMIRIAGQNVIESYMWYPGYTTRDDAILGLTLPEMILSQREHFVAVSPYAYEVAKERMSKKWKIRLSAVFSSPSAYVGIVGKETYTTLTSFKGKKNRVWEVQQGETLKTLGIPAQTMAQADIYLALKSGVLDGAVWYPSSMLLSSMYEVAPYYSTLYQGCALLGFGVSEIAFNNLPKELQETVKKVESDLMKKWFAEANGWVKKYDDPSIEKLKEKGAKVLADFPQADKDLLVKTGIEVWRERAKAIGSTEAIEYQKKMEEHLIRTKPRN